MDINNISFEDIKAEMQGDKGLIKTIRDNFLPNTKEMTQAAQKIYDEKVNDYSNIDSALDNILVIEYELYKEKQKKLNEDFIHYADTITTSSNYKLLHAIIDDYKAKSMAGNDPTKILSGITNIIIALADSNRQSRVSRAGTSLMENLAFLLEKKGFIFNEHFKREHTILGTGCKVDFFFPHDEAYTKEPKNCVAVSCQTTSNDRFRLAFAQIPKNTRNRACTAIGCTNFGDKLGPQSLTDNKLKEAKENGIQFVILESAMDIRIKNSNAAMTYNEWFDELTKLKVFW